MACPSLGSDVRTAGLTRRDRSDRRASTLEVNRVRPGAASRHCTSAFPVHVPVYAAPRSLT